MLHLRTFSNDSPLTLRPAIDDRTFCANSSRFVRSSLAASEGRKNQPERESKATASRPKRTLVERVIGVGFEEEVLESNHNRVEVEYWLPVLALRVNAH